MSKPLEGDSYEKQIPMALCIRDGRADAPVRHGGRCLRRVAARPEGRVHSTTIQDVEMFAEQLPLVVVLAGQLLVV